MTDAKHVSPCTLPIVFSSAAGCGSCQRYELCHNSIVGRSDLFEPDGSNARRAQLGQPSHQITSTSLRRQQC